MAARTLALIFFASLLLVPTLAGPVRAEPPPPKDALEKDTEVSTATEEALKEIIAAHKDVLKTKDADKIRNSLHKLYAYDNEKLRDIVEPLMKYRLSAEDRKAVKAECRSRGIRKPKRVQALRDRREEQVQVLAVRIRARYPDNSIGRTFHKLLLDKKIEDGKPRLVGELIEGMGRVGYTRAYDAIKSEFRKKTNKYAMRGAVIYFGLLKDKKGAKMLCNWIEAPQPGSVNSATNPPASYWEAQWKTWEFIKAQVVWALREITSEHPSFKDGVEFLTNKQANDWMRDHGRRLGIK